MQGNMFNKMNPVLRAVQRKDVPMTNKPVKMEIESVC